MCKMFPPFRCVDANVLWYVLAPQRCCTTCCTHRFWAWTPGTCRWPWRCGTAGATGTATRCAAMKGAMTPLMRGGQRSFSHFQPIPVSPGRLKLIRSAFHGLRPYHTEHARSRPISEAKQCRAWLVLGWETAWEYQVL